MISRFNAYLKSINFSLNIDLREEAFVLHQLHTITVKIDLIERAKVSNF